MLVNLILEIIYYLKLSAQVDLQRVRFTDRVSVMEYSSVPFLKIVHPLHERDKLRTFSLAGTSYLVNPESFQTVIVKIS